MKTALQITSYLALALIIVPPVLYLAAAMEKSTMSTVMIVGTVLWFATVPWWMGRGRY